VVNRSSAVPIIGVAVIMLVLGAALGSVAFPATKIVTTTLFSSITLTQKETVTQSFDSTASSSESIQNYVSSPACPSLAPSGLMLVNESNNNQQSDLTFLMKSDSVATICVSYQLDSGTSLPTAVNFSGFEIQEVNATPTPNQSAGSGYTYSYSPAPGISETATPGVLNIPAGFNKSRIIVNYTITTTAQAKGFYTLSFYEACPPLIPFSVGYGSAQVNASDFEGFFIASGCTVQAPLSDAQIVGFGAMGTIILSQ
jgi:hypothetical protein